MDILPLLRCPATGSPLLLDGDALRSERARYPIVGGVPRFVSSSNYAANFGMQWNLFARTQLDSHSGLSISADRFWAATGWTPEMLQGKLVLDAGCGSGRFAEIALKAGARVVAIDYSSAVDACVQNLREHPRLTVIQADIYALPFAPASFDFVYSLGVLQHTPDVERAFAQLTRFVKPGGALCVDYYWRRLRTMLNLKYVLRPITRRMDAQRLFRLLQGNVGWMLKISNALGRVPIAGRALQRLVPVCDYSLDYPLSAQQLYEWALLDTFDMLAPRFDNPQTAAAVRSWCERQGLTDIEVFKAGHLVARGRMGC